MDLLFKEARTMAFENDADLRKLQEEIRRERERVERLEAEKREIERQQREREERERNRGSR